LEKVIRYINSHNKKNLVFVQSTPGEYIAALKKENISWPVRYADVFPYATIDDDFWVGFYTSRPGAKKMIKDASALQNAQNKLFSQLAIREGINQTDVNDKLGASNKMLTALSLYQHHDAITGTAKQAVANDYAERLQKAIDSSSGDYQEELEKHLFEATGIQVGEKGMQTCLGSQNDTVWDCPIMKTKNKDKLDFIVIVHNQANIAN